MIVLELEVIKETPQKRITLVRELDKRNIYIKKELKTYNKTIWEKLKQLDIEGIPHIYSIEENEDGLACQTLSDILDEHTFSNLEAYQIIRQLCIILDVLHQQDPQIIHRDIKPENIFYDGKQVYLFDFDIARNYIENQKRDTTVLGSQGYAAPEQFGFYQTDIRSDIYSLGITMYEMVTGHVPFDHENGVTIALMHLQNEITPPSQIRDGIPDSLEKIILKCTMKKPEDRYQTADELIADLKLVFEDTSGEYVGIVPTIDDSPTIMIDQNELTQRIQTNDDTQPVEDSDSNAYLEEDDEEEETGMNSKIEKLVIVLAAVVGAIILISIVVFVVKSSGLFKSGKSTTQSTIAATTEAKHHNTTEKYTVDNYIGLSLEAAREAIDNKFKINVTEEYSDTYAKGLVMQQDPESDTELEEGKTIKLVVSKGQKIEDKVSVPDVRSKTKSGAQSELKAAGLKVSIKEAYSDDVAKGEVISQTPSHGSKVSKNTTVVITVSKGKKEDQTVSVPNLRYYTESEASQELQRFGLSLGSVLTEYSDSVEKGLVIRQRISSGSKVKKGTAVGIYVSLGPRQTATTADEESTTTDEE